MSRDALIVGINRYQHLPDLKAPALDAEEIAQRLETDGDFDTLYRLPEGITEEEVKKPLVSDTHPVLQEQLEQALNKLFKPASPQAPDTALFYFSGHGIPDTDGFDQGYLATSDTNPDQSHSGLSLRWLQWLLSESTIKQQIIWLDCCHSGALLVNVGAANPGHGESKDRCFIASSRDFEESWEDLNSSYSVLTKALLDGLDPKCLPGRWIDTFSLVDYVNQALKGELQTPVCTNFGEAINLTRGLQVQEEPGNINPVDSDTCPYKGLEFFDCNDEDPKYFFGREQLVGQLLDQVRTSNFMALVGASGNGKSSVLRAGLLHQLKLGRRISESDQWRIRITRPDHQPMQNLALAFVEDELSDLDRAEAFGRASGLLNGGAAGLQRLVQASTASRTVLVIDQFEEIFTRCENLEEREQFFACLMGALANTDDKLCLIIAMRSDFIVKCHEQEYSGLARQIDQHLVSVLPMQKEELQEAIIKPAESKKRPWEEGLVHLLIEQTVGRSGAMPLLQFALTQLWEGVLYGIEPIHSLEEIGGVGGALASKAESLYKNLNKKEQVIARSLLLGLVQLEEGTSDTRRWVALEYLVPNQYSLEQVEKVLTEFSSPEIRLITVSEDNGIRKVELTHEAIIENWLQFKTWLDIKRKDSRFLHRLDEASISWQENSKPEGDLWRGRQLKSLHRYARRKSNNLTQLQVDFYTASANFSRKNIVKEYSLYSVLFLALSYSLYINIDIEYFIPKTIDRNTYFIRDSNIKNDRRDEFYEDLLRLILSNSDDIQKINFKKRDIAFEQSDRDKALNIDFIDVNNHKRTRIDIDWMMSTGDRDTSLEKIDFPITLGLLAHRLCLVNDQKPDVQTEKDAHVTQVEDWPDYKILYRNGITVEPSESNEDSINQLFNSSSNVNCYARGLSEIDGEKETIKENENKEISINKNFYFRYFSPIHFYVKKDNTELSTRVITRLRELLNSGEFRCIYEKHFRKSIVNANLESKKEILLGDEFSKEGVISNKDLYLDFAKPYNEIYQIKSNTPNKIGNMEREECENLSKILQEAREKEK